MQTVSSKAFQQRLQRNHFAGTDQDDASNDPPESQRPDP
jgi:hypothetical protein